MTGWSSVFCTEVTSWYCPSCLSSSGVSWGSQLEPLCWKIVLYCQPPDFGMQILDLRSLGPCGLAPPENTPDRPSTACFFHVLTWFGCTMCFAAISGIVRSSRNASSATLALNQSENFRRFVISVFLHRVGIHLNRLSDFAGPLQIILIFVLIGLFKFTQSFII